MTFELPLNNNTYIPYAKANFSTSELIGLEEFHDDIKLLTYIKRILRKYHRNPNEIKLDLLLNHIITLRNVFSTIPTVRLLFFYCDTYTYPALKTILIYLEMMPNDYIYVPEANIELIKLDDTMIECLRTRMNK